MIRFTIGEYPAFTLKDAREEAAQIIAQVARDADPAKDRKRGSNGKPRTFGELAARYVADKAQGKRSGFKDEQMLKKDVLPDLEGEPLESIKRVDVTLILDRIKQRGAEIQANRTFEVIRQVFGYAVEKGFLETSPIQRMKAPCKTQSRDRILSHNEIRVFWARMDGRAKMAWETQMILRLCLVTGQRVAEVSGARRSEMRLDKKEWHLPGARVKNGSAHIVRLSPMAMALFDEAMGRSEHEDFIFPSPMKSLRHRAASHVTPVAAARAMRRSRDVFRFAREATPHDLRRTLASGLGFPRLIQDKVLNHVSADRGIIAGVYDRYEYMREKRAALEAWAAHLAVLIDGHGSLGNVVALPLQRS